MCNLEDAVFFRPVPNGGIPRMTGVDPYGAPDPFDLPDDIQAFAQQVGPLALRYLMAPAPYACRNCAGSFSAWENFLDHLDMVACARCGKAIVKDHATNGRCWVCDTAAAN